MSDDTTPAVSPPPAEPNPPGTDEAGGGHEEEAIQPLRRDRSRRRKARRWGRKRSSEPVTPTPLARTSAPSTPAIDGEGSSEKGHESVPSSTEPAARPSDVEPTARHCSTHTGSLRKITPRGGSATTDSVKEPAAVGVVPAGSQEGPGQKPTATREPVTSGPPAGGVSGADASDAEAKEAASTATSPAGGAAARRMAAVAFGLAVVVLVGAGVAGTSGVGGILPAASSPQMPVPAAAVPIGPTQNVCPGPARPVTGVGENNAPQFGPASPDAKTRVNALVGPTPDGSLPPSRLTPVGKGDPLAQVSSSTGPREGAPYAHLEGKELDTASVLRAETIEKRRTLAGAVQLYSASEGDMRGLAAASCQNPSNDGWFVGASTEVGRTALLYLANPAESPATVTLEFYGSDGKVKGQSPVSVLVPAGVSQAVDLSGYAPGQKNLGLHYSSSGAPVGVSLQQSVRRGLSVGSVELLTPVAAPGLQQIIPGVMPMAKERVDQIAGQEGYADAKSTVQVLVPSGGDSVVRIQAWSVAGQVPLPNGGVLTAKGGGVSEFVLETPDPGPYTVTVTSENTITASVRTTHGSGAGQPVDIAVAGAATPLTGDQLVVLPEAAASQLVLAASQDPAQVSLAPIDKSGNRLAPTTMQVAAGVTTKVEGSSLSGGKDVVGFVLAVSGGSAFGALAVSSDVGASVTSISESSLYAQQQAVSISY